MSNFEKELERLINRFSEEQASNTPDFILARYLVSCLASYAMAVQSRDAWYSKEGIAP